jgi:hypothetical protein
MTVKTIVKTIAINEEDGSHHVHLFVVIEVAEETVRYPLHQTETVVIDDHHHLTHAAVEIDPIAPGTVVYLHTEPNITL